ncbi:lipopolysaccharide biosynthesis protein [Bradyrhizobium japonicum]|uniref:lipopolysaccharide biosynthesis protein n=1 Tax=Bradyrhizobium japonicum TaxID=375 RepID=UPI0033957D87
MLRRFLHNTAISAVAYGVAGVLGLFAVGLIAKSYGLAVLGLIVLLRSFLPSGFLAVIDLGVSEITTQVIARGRLGDWSTAGEKVSLLTMLALVTGLLSGVLLWFCAADLAAIFKVHADQSADFIAILKVTALIMPIAFLGLAAEGALKGFEQYSWLRLTEVAGSVAYVGSIFIAVWSNLSFAWIAYAYLATIVAKYVVLALVVWLFARNTSLRFRSWTPSSRHDVAYRCWLMFNNRIAGTFQQTLVPLAIGALYSPVEVGTYDVLTRLPRFLKTTMSPLYSAILPISAHLDERTDVRRLQLLGRNGLVLPAAIVVPILVVVALFFSRHIAGLGRARAFERMAVVGSVAVGSRCDCHAGGRANRFDGQVGFPASQHAAALSAGPGAVCGDSTDAGMAARACLHIGVGAILCRICAPDRAPHALGHAPAKDVVLGATGQADIGGRCARRGDDRL